MRRTIYLIILMAFSSAQAATPAPGCEPWLKGSLIYRTAKTGKLVEKLETFALTDWSPDMSYEGILLVQNRPNTPNSTLDIDFVSESGKIKAKKLLKRQAVFPRDASYRHFPEFDPQKFFVFKESGRYTVTLKDRGQVICSETFNYRYGEVVPEEEN